LTAKTHGSTFVLESLAPVTTSVTVRESEAQTLALHVPAC